MRRRRKNPGGSLLALGVGALALGGLGFYLYKRGVFGAGGGATIALRAPALTPQIVLNQQHKDVTDKFSVGSDFASDIPAAPPGYTLPSPPQTYAAVTTSLSAAPQLSFRQALAGRTSIRAPRGYATTDPYGAAPPPL